MDNVELGELMKKGGEDPWTVRFKNGPMEGQKAESNAIQKVVSLWWPPKEMDPLGNEPKKLYVYELCGQDKHHRILWFQVKEVLTILQVVARQQERARQQKGAK